MTTLPIPNVIPQLSLDRLTADLARIRPAIWQSQQSLSVEGSVGLTDISGLECVADLAWEAVSKGDSWGGASNEWRQRWFKVQIPAALEHQRGQRHLIWQANGEHTVHLNGTAWAGIDCGHPSCLLPDDACELIIESSLWQTGIWNNPKPLSSTGCRFESATIAIRDEDVWQLVHDIEALIGCAWRVATTGGGGGNALEGGRHHRCPSMATAPPLLRILVDGLTTVIRTYDEQGAAAARDITAQLFARLRSNDWAGQATFIGHSHLDLVWMWTEGATRRKFLHTAATVAGLMDRNDELTYINSQPWLLDRLALDDPQLAQRVAKHIASGRWELEGMFEVESDVLLSGGETLVRCLVRGQDAMIRHRGRRAGVVWIPDVFGYSGCLPQLIRLAGGRGFFTSKLSWNRVTSFPYSSFVWEGDDGSEVVAHLPPIGFNGDATVNEVGNAAEDHRQLAVHPNFLPPLVLVTAVAAPPKYSSSVAVASVI